jgi:hypothetical protein
LGCGLLGSIKHLLQGSSPREIWVGDPFATNGRDEAFIDRAQ